MFLFFFYYIIQYIYLIVFYSNTQDYEIETYDYEIDGEKRQSIIYTKKSSKKSKECKDTPENIPSKKKNLLLFLSGAYNLEMHSYIIKTMNDIESYHPEVANIYDMICYENKNRSSIIIYDDVAYFIQKWYENISKTSDITEEDASVPPSHDLPRITIIGYSAGGVVASHIMSRIKHIPATFKLITYDTPWQIRDNVDAFSKYIFYRIDAIFFYKVYLTYLCHYNIDKISVYLKNTRVGYKWNGAKEMFELIKNIHQYDDAEFYKNTGFNFDQSPTLKAIHLYHKNDPLICRHAHDLFYEKHKHLIKFENHFIELNSSSHCSDMAFSTRYLDTLIPVILE